MKGYTDLSQSTTFLRERILQNSTLSLWLLIIGIQIIAGISVCILPFPHAILIWLAIALLFIGAVRPYYAYLLVLFFLFPQGYQFVQLFQVGQATIRIVDFAMFLALGVCLLRGMVDRRFTLSQSAVDIPIYILLGYIFFSLFWTPSTGRGIFQLLKTLMGFLTYFLTVNMIRTRNEYKIALMVFFISMAIFSSIGIYEILSEKIHLAFKATAKGYLKSSLMEVEYNNRLGLFLDLALLLAIPLFFTTDSKKTKYALGILIFIMAFSLVGIFSRKSWLGFAVGISFIGLRYRKALFYVVLSATVSLGILFTIDMITSGFFVKALHMKLQTYFLPIEEAIPGRIATWKLGLEHFAQSPLLGHGIGSSYYLATQYDFPLTVTHSFYIYVLEEVGLIGLLILIYLALSLGHRLYEMYKNTYEEKVKFMILGYAAGYLVLMVQGAFRMFGFYERVAWLFLGLTIVFMRLYGPVMHEKPRTKSIEHLGEDNA